MDSRTEAEAVAVELFRTPEGRADPYPRYHHLRDIAPVFRSETAHAWLLTRYADCHSGLRDPRLGKDYPQRLDASRPGWRERPSLRRFERSMLNVDGPYHTRLRRSVSKVFTFRSVEQMRPAIGSMVDELLDPIAAAGRGDLLDDLAFPLPVTVIGELLGVPDGDRARFRDLVRDLTAVFEIGATPEQLDVADAASTEIDAYFYDLVARRRRSGGDDLLSALVGLPESAALEDDEIVTLASLLFLAGFETTTNLIGNGMLGLLRQPEQVAQLRERPELYANLADELLRYDGTAQMVSRQTKTDLPIDESTIPEGSTVLMIIGAGNHDPERYADPDRIDVTRADVRPLSFGGGVHFCLGAALARAEIEIAFEKLLDRFPTIELDGPEPVHRDRLTLRGLAALPVRMNGSAGARTRFRAPQARAPALSPSHRREARPGTLPPRPAGAGEAAWRERFRRRLEAGDLAKTADELAATVDLLDRIPLFSGCRRADLERLAATAYPIAFDPMQVLCVEGGDSTECYVLAEGEALVTIGGDVVAQLGSDDIVGERGPILRKPRAATVTATTHVLAYAISRDELQALLSRDPKMAETMRAALFERYG